MLTLHHVNLASGRQAEVSAFYQKIIGLQPTPGLADLRQGSAYTEPVDFLTAGATQLHISTTDPHVAFKLGQPINPQLFGHVAFRTDDIESVRAMLNDNNVPHADFSTWAMKGWHQLFFHDPAGNVVEVVQLDDDAE